jgi:hypothetical protein
MRKRNVLVLVVVLLLVVGVGYAAFKDKVQILGMSVTVGSADLRLLNDLGGGVVSENLVDSKSGPAFENISPNWVADYPLALFNNSPSILNLTINSFYETANDPADLRQIIFMELIAWDDANFDGLVDPNELGVSYGKKTIVKWKTEGMDLGQMASGGVKAYVLRFSTDSIPDSKQGTSAVFDFEFNATEVQ